MIQSKLESFIESSLNTLSGFILSFIVWQYAVAPLFGFELSVKNNFYITFIFTVVSVIRSYFWRRFFNAGIHRIIHKWLFKDSLKPKIFSEELEYDNLAMKYKPKAKKSAKPSAITTHSAHG